MSRSRQPFRISLLALLLTVGCGIGLPSPDPSLLVVTDHLRQACPAYSDDNIRVAIALVVSDMVYLGIPAWLEGELAALNNCPTSAYLPSHGVAACQDCIDAIIVQLYELP